MRLPKFKSVRKRNKWLVENKARMIQHKKAAVKECDVVELEGSKSTLKSELKQEDDDSTIYRTIVGNTYNWLDSHGDVHVKGIFSKSINERGDQVLHLHDHVQQLDAEVGENLAVYEKDVAWKDLGVNAEGMTTALMMDSAIQKEMNPRIFAKYQKGRITQHSVGMQYVKLDLAINDSEEKEEFEVWNKYINQIQNKEQAEEAGYFFVVKEAKLIEVSCVIRGSNEITPTLEPKHDLDELLEVMEATKNADATDKEKFLHLCSQVEALKDNEPLNKTLVKQEPRKAKSMFYKNLINDEKSHI